VLAVLHVFTVGLEHARGGAGLRENFSQHFQIKTERRGRARVLTPFFAIERISKAGNDGCFFGDHGPSRRELFFRKKLRGIPPTSSGMPEERNSGTAAERGKIQDDHDEGEKIHSHCQSDGDVHHQNAN